MKKNGKELVRSGWKEKEQALNTEHCISTRRKEVSGASSSRGLFKHKIQSRKWKDTGEELGAGLWRP